MTTETWAAVSMTEEEWTDLEDTLNGYFAPGYARARYVFGSSGVAWVDTSDVVTSWSAV